jgi:methionyl-tRNA formyltransferase
VAREGLQATPQPEAGATYARRMRKEDARLDWRCSAVEIERRVRAYFPWPVAFTTLFVRGRVLRLQLVEVAVADPPSGKAAAGQVVASLPTAWVVACGEGAIRIRRVIPAGRREMTAEEFLRGFPVPEGICLGAGTDDGCIGVQ